MEGSSAAEEELERRSRFLSSLIQKKKAIEEKDQLDRLNVRVRASDMPLPLQNRAFRCARDFLDSMPNKLDSKCLALALKKVSQVLCGPKAPHLGLGLPYGCNSLKQKPTCRYAILGNSTSSRTPSVDLPIALSTTVFPSNEYRPLLKLSFMVIVAPLQTRNTLSLDRCTYNH